MKKVRKLIIFVKNEEAGKTKTRLAASIGDEEALDVYRKLLVHTFRQTVPLHKVQKEVWYSRFKAEQDIWSKGDFTKRIQEGERLGERMANAFKKVFDTDNRQKVLIIGSDCAELTTEVVEKAFEELDKSDIVIGPAKDGGYYLLGMKHYYPDLFNGIAWSSEHVFDQTRAKVHRLGLSCAILEELNDVDTLEDWKQVRSNL